MTVTAEEKGKQDKAVVLTLAPSEYADLVEGLTPLETTLRNLALVSFAVVGIGGILSISQPIRPELYLYGPAQAIYGRYANTESLVGENSVIFDSLGSLQLQLKRLRTLPANWDGEGGERIQEETLSSANDLLGSISDAMFRLGGPVPAPLVSPCSDGRVCFSWKRADKELWIYVQGHTADVYRWEPRGRYESEPFEQIAIPTVSEHVAWFLS